MVRLGLIAAEADEGGVEPLEQRLHRAALEQQRLVRARVGVGARVGVRVGVGVGVGVGVLGLGLEPE